MPRHGGRGHLGDVHLGALVNSSDLGTVSSGGPAASAAYLSWHSVTVGLRDRIYGAGDGFAVWDMWR